MKVSEDLYVYNVSMREFIVFQATKISNGFLLIDDTFIGITGSAVRIKIDKTYGSMSSELDVAFKFYEKFTRPLSNHARRTVLYPEYLKVKTV